VFTLFFAKWKHMADEIPDIKKMVTGRFISIMVLAGGLIPGLMSLF
jgi:hypothetical protein